MRVCVYATVLWINLRVELGEIVPLHPEMNMLTSLHVCCHSGSCFGAHGTPTPPLLWDGCPPWNRSAPWSRPLSWLPPVLASSRQHLLRPCVRQPPVPAPSNPSLTTNSFIKIRSSSPLPVGMVCFHRLELGEEDVDTAILFRRVGLRQTARTDGRLAEDSTGHVFVIGFGRNTEHRGCHGHSLHQSHWGQIDPVGDISDGEDRIDVGSAVLVDQDLPSLRVKSHTRRLQGLNDTLTEQLADQLTCWMYEQATT